MNLYEISKRDSGSNILKQNGQMGQICSYSHKKYDDDGDDDDDDDDDDDSTKPLPEQMLTCHQ